MKWILSKGKEYIMSTKLSKIFAELQAKSEIAEEDLSPGLVLYLNSDELKYRGVEEYSGSMDTFPSKNRPWICIRKVEDVGLWVPVMSNEGPGRIQVPEPNKMGNGSWKDKETWLHVQNYALIKDKDIIRVLTSHGSRDNILANRIKNPEWIFEKLGGAVERPAEPPVLKREPAVAYALDAEEPKATLADYKRNGEALAAVRTETGSTAQLYAAMQRALRRLEKYVEPLRKGELTLDEVAAELDYSIPTVSRGFRLWRGIPGTYEDIDKEDFEKRYFQRILDGEITCSSAARELKKNAGAVTYLFNELLIFRILRSRGVETGKYVPSTKNEANYNRFIEEFIPKLEKKSITQAEVAHELGVSVGTISAWLAVYAGALASPIFEKSFSRFMEEYYPKLIRGTCTQSDAAAALGISESTLSRWKRQAAARLAKKEGYSRKTSLPAVSEPPAPTPVERVERMETSVVQASSPELNLEELFVEQGMPYGLGKAVELILGFSQSRQPVKDLEKAVELIRAEVLRLAR